MKEIMNKDNPFYNKLQEWYGNNLNPKKTEVLYIDKDETNTYAITFLIRNENHIEVARVIHFGNSYQISIDCQADVNTMQGVRKLIQYGSNFKRFDIED